MIKRLIMLTALLLSAVAYTVAQTSFKLVPPRNVIAGQNFHVIYRLTNGEGTSLNAPAINGCKLLTPRPGMSTMQSVQIINGVQSSSTTIDYTFTYRAEKDGTFTVPAASIVVDGKTLHTSQASFKVLPPDKNASQQGNGYGNPMSDFDEFESDAAQAKISKDDIFVRVILNKSKAYEGEAIECTLKLYTKYERINSFMVTSPPTFDGFLIDEIDTQAALNQIEHYNGQNYITAVLKRCIIFPQKSGKLTINSGRYDLSVVQLERISNGFFISARPVEKEVHLQPFTQSVNITPLPQPQPAGFTGAVGQFKYESAISTTTPRTGEAISLKYIVTGTGNIKYISAAKPQIPSEFEQYTPKTDANARIAGSTLTGTMTTEYTIVPQSVGKFKIPSQNFVYFDLGKKQYVTLTADGFTLDVAKGSGTTANVEQRDIAAMNTDILHIKTGDKDQQIRHTPVVRQWWYWTIYICMILAFTAAVAIARHRMKLDADVAGRRNSRANKVARKRLKMAAKFMAGHQSELFYQEVLKALWGYLSDKLSMPASQLTRQNIVDTLSDRGVSEETCSEIVGVLDDCEMARYTPDSSLDSSVEAIYNRASQAINSLERNKLTPKNSIG